VGKSRRCHHELGIAAINIAARGTVPGAKVLTARATPLTLTAGGINPGDPDPFPELPVADLWPEFVDLADHLVAGNDRQAGWRDPTLNLIEFRVADAAGYYLDPYLTRARFGNGAFHQVQGVRLRVQSGYFPQRHGFHRSARTPSSKVVQIKMLEDTESRNFSPLEFTPKTPFNLELENEPYSHHV
jgi:hypothetical protein